MEGVDQSGGSVTGGGAPCTAAAFEGAFTDAFVRVDEELAKATDAAQVGPSSRKLDSTPFAADLANACRG